MCSAPDPAPIPPPPPLPPPPMRSDEENDAAQQDEIDLARRRRGKAGTVLTGGLGDPGFGSNVSAPTAGGGTTLGGA